MCSHPSHCKEHSRWVTFFVLNFGPIWPLRSHKNPKMSWVPETLKYLGLLWTLKIDKISKTNYWKRILWTRYQISAFISFDLAVVQSNNNIWIKSYNFSLQIKYFGFVTLHNIAIGQIQFSKICFPEKPKLLYLKYNRFLL